MTASAEDIAWAKRKLAPAAIGKVPSRRKASLRRQFARHWDMIWHLRKCGMAGRTLRQIYGDAALIWSVGGGIDAEI